MRVLGIETSCDETSAAVIRRTADGRGEILANVVLSQTQEHAAYGGVVPEIAARAHVAHLDRLIAGAMAEADVGFGDLDGVAATAGPGLIGGLLVGLTTGKAVALAHGLPLVAVNHLEAHALTPGLTDGLQPPYLLLLISGGHTQTLAVEDVGDYRRYGTTIDDALGEAFDKTAKLLGLGYPGGPLVERAAAEGNPERFRFPRPMLRNPEPNFSFSGLKTAVRQAVQALDGPYQGDVADICASFEAAVAESVEDRLRLAIRRFRAEHPAIAAPALVVSGGVAANRRLRRMFETLTEREGLRLCLPPPALCTDNAAMVAWAGAERLARGLVDGLDAPARPRWPLDPGAAPAPFAGVKA
ncbi:MAG: tRNA (adenosine(37)-N6)-threonylcarbamoyltransferase complex transferase subunit TsaD [Parvibaculaceae bacterium]